MVLINKHTKQNCLTNVADVFQIQNSLYLLTLTLTLGLNDQVLCKTQLHTMGNTHLMFVMAHKCGTYVPVSVKVMTLTLEVEVQSTKVCWCNKQVIVWVCVCTDDNLFAKLKPVDFLPVQTHRP